MDLTVAVARSVAATIARGMAAGAGFAAVVFAVFDDMMALRDFAFAVGAGAFLLGDGWHCQSSSLGVIHCVVVMEEKVINHNVEHAVHTGIRHRVKHLFAAPFGSENPGRAQQAQVMAGQRGRHADMLGYVTGRPFHFHAGDNNRQACGIGQQAECFGQFRCLISI